MPPDCKVRPPGPSEAPLGKAKSQIGHIASSLSKGVSFSRWLGPLSPGGAVEMLRISPVARKVSPIILERAAFVFRHEAWH